MEAEDKEFFILVLGVLAAILVVISWWFAAVSADFGAATTNPTTGTAVHNADNDNDNDDADASHGDHHEPDQDHGADPDHADPDSDAPGNSSASDDTTIDKPTAATVFDAIAAHPDLSVISGLLRDSNLDQVLAAGGPFTVFVPSNEAISQAASSDATVAVLAADQENVLTYHVVPGGYTVEDLSEIARGEGSTKLMTVQGETISLSFESGNVTINGSTTVLPTSEETGNGFVHTLDNVLVPPIGALNALVARNPILFATGSADIQPDSFPTLDSFIEILSANNVDVTIEGHTDSSGGAILNQNLSQGRARSVLNYLVANGVDESRLDAQGFGADRPVADNESEEGRALNRRIEFALG